MQRDARGLFWQRNAPQRCAVGEHHADARAARVAQAYHGALLRRRRHVSRPERAA
jgi:hypothetical protein